MFTFLLQEWTTIGGQSSIRSITQGANGWLALPEFQDATFWLDANINASGGATAIQMNYETSPIREEALFLPMRTVTIAAGTNTPVPILLNQNPAVPLAQWVRWRLSVTGTLTAKWQVTFRVRVAANATTKYYLGS